MFPFLQNLFGGGATGGAAFNDTARQMMIARFGRGGGAGLGFDPATGKIGAGAALNPGATLMPQARGAFLGFGGAGNMLPPGAQPGGGVEPGMWSRGGVEPGTWTEKLANPPPMPQPRPQMDAPPQPPAAGLSRNPYEMMRSAQMAQAFTPPAEGILKHFGQKQEQEKPDPRQMGPLLAFLAQNRKIG